VSASDGTVGLALVHDGLLEYELTNDGRELALTLLRATGYLSRLDLALRPDPAGPALALRGAQMPGPYECSYAVVPHAGDWRTARLFEVADALHSPIEHRQGGGVGQERPASGRELEVRGATVSAVLRDESGGLVVRVVRTDPEPGTVTVHRAGAPARGAVVDLRGRTEAVFEGSAYLRPWQIFTVRLGDDPAASV
jgi:alpha-mannosidase